MIQVCKLLQIEQDIHACKECDLGGKINPHPFSQYADFTKLKEVKCMYVGRNPGLEHQYVSSDLLSYRAQYHSNFIESNFGKYLVGAIGLQNFSMYGVFTNIVKCPTPNNIEPKLNQYATCGKYLLKQIDELQPKKVLVFGRSIVRALSMMIGDRGYPTVHGTYKGYFSFIDIVGTSGDVVRRIISLYHPSFFARGGSKDIAERQLKLLKEECECQ